MNEPDLISGSSQLPNIVPVIDTIPADLLTPLSVYLKLSMGAKDSFLLESVEGGENLARFSFIGAEPEFVVRGNDRATTIMNVPDDRTINSGQFRHSLIDGPGLAGADFRLGARSGAAGCARASALPTTPAHMAIATMCRTTLPSFTFGHVTWRRPAASTRWRTPASR